MNLFRHIRRVTVILVMVAGASSAAGNPDAKALGANVQNLLAPPAASAPTYTSTLPPITLGECVQRALAHGFAMNIERLALAIARDDVPIAESIFRPQLSARASAGVAESIGGPLSPESRIETSGTSVGIGQRFSLGTDIELGLNLDRSSVDPLLAALDPSYASRVTLNLRQPLLRGFGGDINELPIQRAKIGIGRVEQNLRDRALEVIEATENAYYLLAGARDQLAVFDKSLELAQALLDEAQSRHAAGMANKIDLLQARVGVANARLNVLEAEKTVRSSEDALRAVIGQFELGTPLGPTVLNEFPHPVVAVESSYARALENAPAVLNARAALDLATLDIAAANDDLKPSLDLDLTLGLDSRDTSGGGALADTLAPDGSSWEAGLTVTVPFGRAAEKAGLRQSRAAYRREQLRLSQLEQDVLLQVRNAVRDVETSRASVDLAALAAGLSEQQHLAEIERFSAGLSTSRRVFEALTDLESARVTELQAKLNLRTALAALHRIEGSSLKRYAIELR